MKDLQGFFNNHAQEWDSHIRHQDLLNIEKIMDYAGLSENDSILDVGTGTGVLVPFFLNRGIKNITAVDFSSAMVKVFKSKFKDIKIHNIDYEEKFFDNNSFSKIFIFNTFPHFRNYDEVFRLSYSYLVPKGKLIIAHSMSREELNLIHRNAGEEVEKDILVPDNEFVRLYAKHDFGNVKIISEDLFFSSGEK